MEYRERYHQETEQCSCQVLASTFNFRIAAVGSRDNSSNESLCYTACWLPLGRLTLRLNLQSVTDQDAIRWISSAWNNVREETILTCFRRAGFASPETDLQEQEDSTSESDLFSALPEALQFEVASENDILENEANIPVHENIASTAEGILEDVMTGRVQGAPLDDEQDVEEEEVDQQPPNRPPSHSEA